MLKSERVSESLRLGTLLAVTGGFMDAYSYIMRGGVFATAETGNIVLMAINLAEGKWGNVLHYLIPITAFAFGVYVAELIRKSLGPNPKIHWKEGILWLEILIVLIAGFIPQAGNNIVNPMIAFVCAMQVEAFRRVRGKAYATTMCTGNLRSGTELFALSQLDHDPLKRREGWHFYWIDLSFIIGAILSSFFCRILGEKAIWICGATLLSAILFVRCHKNQKEV